jgi:squalene-hopene/tetraprenyl-beta-curcumene cyclase
MPTACVVILLALGAAPDPGLPTTDEVRTAVRRSIPYIEQKGEAWIREKKCVSCHRAGNMAWTLGAAREKGFTVSRRLDEWFTWSLEKSLSRDDQGKIDGAANREGVAQLLLARQFFAGADRAETYRQLQKVIAEGQQADGAWKPGGQLPSQKRPADETAVVSTAWVALALPADAPDEAFKKAVERVSASPPGQSTEWWAVALLLAERTGDRSRVGELIGKLRGQQQADGGWGWTVGEPSDALGTGVALYALLRAGVGRDDASIQRGRQFLVRTQRDDGSWPVHGTKANKKGGIEETAVYWGTAWAALALVESLPAAE